MRVLITPTSLSSNLAISALDPLRERGADLVANPHGRPMTSDELVAALSGVDGVIAGLDSFSADVIAEAPELKVISRYGVGYDRIDLEAARRSGVRVTNAPGANAHSVSELALGLMFAVARQIPQASAAVAAGGWPRIQGIELAGRRLGLIGLGSIGRGTAAMARGIGMDVMGFDLSLSDEDITALGVTPASLDRIFMSSDVLSLHIPLNAQTRHIVSAERIASMQVGAMIINTARGGLIDEEAAVEALEAGRLIGLGVDAYETEPPRDSPLVRHPKVVATPHTGAHSRESVQRTAAAAVKNLLTVLDGKEPTDVIV